MQETKSIKAILSAEDANFTTTMDRAASKVKSFASRVKSGVGFGAFMAIGQKAVNTVTAGMKSMVGQMDQTNAAWTTFADNMKAAGHSTGEIEKAKKSMQEFASQSIYYSSEMAATYAQLDAVGIKGTTNLVKGFGGVAAAAQNPSQAMKTLSQQATQMAAKPQVAWQDFKLMLEQTPAGIAQIAKVMNMSTKELVSAIQNGEVKTEDFFEAIRKIGGDANNELMKSATKYKTIGEAINGTSGYLMTKLAPAWSVVSKAAIKALGKVQGVIGKIDSDAVAKKVESGIRKAKEIFIEIKPALKAAGSMFLTFGKTVVSVLPTLAKLAPVLVPAFAAFKGYTTIAPAAKAVYGFASIWKNMGLQMAIATANGGASTTQMIASTQGLGAALKTIVNPAGLAVAGVVALGLAVNKFQNYMATVPGTWQNAKSASDEASGSLREAGKSYEALKQASEEQVTQGLSEVEHVKDLKTELDGLVDKNGKVKKGYGQRAQTIVNAISKATGVELEYVDGVVKGYKDAGKAVDDYVEKKRALIRLEAGESTYKKAMEGQSKAQKAMEKAQKEMANANDKLLSGDLGAKGKYQQALADYKKYSKEMMIQEAAMNAFEKGNYEEAERILTEHTLSKKQIKELGNQTTKAQDDAALQNQVAQNEKIANEMQQGLSLDAAIEQMKTKANKKGLEVPKSVTDGIRSGQYMLPSSVKEMTNLVKLDELSKKAGKEGVKIPRGIKNGIVKGQYQVPASVKQLNALIKYDSLAKKAKDAGVKVPSKIKTGIESGKMKPTEAVKAMNDLLSKKAGEGTKKVGKESKKTGEEIGKGVKSGESKATKSASNIITKLSTKLSGGAKQASSAGRNISTGFAAGMNAAASSAERAAERIVAAAEKAARAKAKMHSPSRLFAKLGKYVSQGFAIGMIKDTRRVYKAGTAMAGAADDGVTDYLQIASPSKKGKKRGKQTTQGIIAGIKAGSKKIPKSVGKSLKAAFGSKMVSKLPVNLQKQIKKVIGKKKTWKNLSKRQTKSINAAIGKYKFNSGKLTKDITKGFTSGIKTAKNMVSSTLKSMDDEVQKFSYTDMANDKVDFKGVGDNAAKSFIEAYEAKTEKMRWGVEDKITANTNKLAFKYTNLAANASKKEANAKKQAAKYEKLASKAKKKGAKKKYNTLAKKYNKIAAKQGKIAEKNKTKAESVKNAASIISSQFESAYNDMVAKAKESAQEQINAISEKYDKLYQNLKQKRDNFYSKLSSHEGLFTKEDIQAAEAVYDSYGFLVKAATDASSAMKIVNFDEQTRKIKQYKANLDKLKAAGVSMAYLEEMTQNLSYTDGLEFTNKLLTEGTQKAIAYGKSYENMIGVANDLSNQWYKSDFESLKSQYSADIARVEADLKTKLDNIAKNTMAGFKNSLQREIKKADLGKVGTAMANKLIKAIKKKLKIKSPSRVMASLGSYTGEGFIKGLEGSEKDVYKAMDNIITMPQIRRPEMKMAAGAELNSNYSYGSTIDGEIVVVTTIDGKVVAQTTAPYTEEILNKRQIRESRKQGRL